MARLLLWVIALFGFAGPALAQADDVAAASRSVVRVVVAKVEGDQIADFGHGSGFAVAPNRIVTNAHVVALAVSDPDNVRIGVVPSEGSEATAARIIAVDPARDLALLEIQQGSIPVVPLFIARLQPGMAVAALGYPGNVDMATAQSIQDYIRPLPPTRSMGNYSDLRQGDSGPTLVHTADIARGHSGGPLVDACGRVIGVNRMITRNDMGDSTFGFAIPVGLLVDFLREARQPFRSIAAECVSAEARQREEAERAERERRERESDEASRTREADERRARTLAAIEESRETRLYVAVLLLVLSLAAMGAAGILVVRNQPRPAMIAGGAAALLLIASAAVFLTRPSRTGAVEEKQSGDAGDADRFVGENSCRLDRERSRVTVSNDERVELVWDAEGCVNENTQYAQDGAVWRRVLVPNGEQTVTVSEFNPGSGDYVVNRYLLSASDMEAARRLRRRVEQKACTSDQEARLRMADQQRDL
ncbi:MAG TPA: serine protease, partial [Allosphingosinicella sp.]